MYGLTVNGTGVTDIMNTDRDTGQLQGQVIHGIAAIGRTGPEAISGLADRGNRRNWLPTAIHCGRTVVLEPVWHIHQPGTFDDPFGPVAFNS